MNATWQPAAEAWRDVWSTLRLIAAEFMLGIALRLTPKASDERMCLGLFIMKYVGRFKGLRRK